jgi:predicted NUDIX family NTP pyrophosphohydrolase
MSVHSAGILLFRFREERLEVLLVHPGGPFWSGKDEGAWSIPKGVFEEQESPLQAAKREFKEETGFEAIGLFIDLGMIKQPSKKIVHVWAQQLDLDAALATSNKFMMEWPKKSGVMREFPEVDKAEWFDAEWARKKILKGQAGFIDRLRDALNYEPKNEPKKEAERKQQDGKENWRRKDQTITEERGEKTREKATGKEDQDHKEPSDQLSLTKWAKE